MTKDQEIIRFNKRIDQINRAPSVQDSIKRLGDGITRMSFGLAFDYTTLSLYKKAEALEKRYGGNYTNMVRNSVEKIIDKLKEPLKQVEESPKLSEIVEDVFDESKVEEITIEYPTIFSKIYRTPETRKLDKEYKVILERGDKLLLAALGYGVTEIECSNIMPIFERIAEKTRYFAGVKVNELEKLVKGYGLDVHVSKRFVKKGTYKGEEICFPVRFI